MTLGMPEARMRRSMKVGDLVRFSWNRGSWIGLVLEITKPDIWPKNSTNPEVAVIFRIQRNDIQQWPLNIYQNQMEVISESR